MKRRTAQLLPARVPDLNGKGLARIEIATHPRGGLELWGPLPGETIEVQLGSRRNLWLQQVLMPHPQRREARCSHYGPCGGCSLQHWSEAGQLEWKSQRLVRRLPAQQVLPPQASPQPFHYRTKVELSFLGEGLGYHRRGCFDRGLTVEHCWIAPPVHRSLVEITREWQREHQLAGWQPRQGVGDLRYLVIRQANALQAGDWLAVLVTRPDLPVEVMQDWARRVEPLAPQGLIWVEQESPAAAVVPARQHLLWGQDRWVQPLGHLNFELSWRSFFQSNPPAYLKMLERLRDWYGQRGPLLDLYCGIGSIGLFISDGALVGVENVPEAIADARRCAAQWGRQARFEVAPAEDWQEWNFPVAVVDPPRSGCHPKLIEKLIEQGPQEVFYISCNPERFLSEWSHLQQVYELKAVQAFDFFPQTAHVELLTWLQRKEGSI
jgi:23S rRNA (uracil-5-)-methyltransferase RumA